MDSADNCKFLISSNLFDFNVIKEAFGGETLKIKNLDGELLINICDRLFQLDENKEQQVVIWTDQEGKEWSAKKFNKELIRNPYDKQVLGLKIQPEDVPLQVHLMCKEGELGIVTPKFSSFKQGTERIKVVTLEH